MSASQLPQSRLQTDRLRNELLQTELFRLEYPTLLPDHDPDIERYYFLRNNGRTQEAMDIYQARLRVRYPNDDFRTQLLRCYRSRDPAFRTLLAQGYQALAALALERIKQLLLYIADKASGYKPRDIYSTLKAAEDILAVLPKEQFEAIATMERYCSYSQALKFREEALRQGLELVRAYLTDTLAVVEEEKRRQARIVQQELDAQRQRLVSEDWASYLEQKDRQPQEISVAPPQRVSRVVVQIDLSSITFSREDLQRIEIPQNILRIEDKTLAYTVKYWYLIEDTAFERILYLYSRKYNTKQYQVYMAIRRGRMTGKREDEILATVMSALVTGYYYSIQGDRYLQRQWNLIRGTILAAAPTQELAAPVLSGTPQLAPPTETIPAAKESSAPQRSPRMQKTVASKRSAKKALASKSPKEAAASSAKKVPTSQSPKKAPEAAALRRGSAAPSAIPVPVQSTGSVSDRLKDLSGRSYDVYQDRFFAKARTAIRRVLGKRRGPFFSIPEEVEDLLYSFLRDHYTDPYMNWEESTERKMLLTLGFDLPSVQGIIDECYKIL